MKLNVNIPRIYLIFMVFLCISISCLGLYTFFYSNNLKKQHTSGNLYSVLDRKHNKYFLVTDQNISEKKLVDTDLQIIFLDSDNLWDPATCAGMPTIIEKNNIWTLEFKVLENKQIQKTLIKYEKNSNTKYYLDLSKYNVLGDLSFEDGFLKFKIGKNNKVYEIKIADNFYENFQYKILYKLFDIYTLDETETSLNNETREIDIKNYSLDLKFLDTENIKYYIIGKYKE